MALYSHELRHLRRVHWPGLARFQTPAQRGDDFARLQPDPFRNGAQLGAHSGNPAPTMRPVRSLTAFGVTFRCPVDAASRSVQQPRRTPWPYVRCPSARVPAAPLFGSSRGLFARATGRAHPGAPWACCPPTSRASPAPRARAPGGAWGRWEACRPKPGRQRREQGRSHWRPSRTSRTCADATGRGSTAAGERTPATRGRGRATARGRG